MPQSWRNRLKTLEKTHGRQRRTFFLWMDEWDTAADIEANRNRLIAEGRASADDQFVQMRWKREGEA
jgi:hypothetical protein